jgi:prepilin-type N-terminal cleavage/methylation domain-containing protein
MRIISKQSRKSSQGFTLIEMIGVLAVIAILASMLIPKIFEAINNAKVNNAAVSYNSVKTALADHYAKWGSLLSSNGTVFATNAAIALTYDKLLVSEGFMDKTFQVKIGTTNTHVQVVGGQTSGATPTPTDSSYDLDGTGGNDASGGVVVEAVITGVTENDARDLSLRLDGDALSTGAVGSDDILGRVKYATGSPTTVYIYVTHR